MIKATVGRSEYVAENEHDLITQLKMEDWSTYANMGEYKDNIRRRVEIFTGKWIMFANDREFLQELLRIGFFDTLDFE